MNLKEAFRYQNKLQSFMDEAQGILDSDANVTKVENTYLRHKVMAEAEDGLAEAVYMPEKHFVWAVQWHPEFSYRTDEDSRKILEAFVKAAGQSDAG